MPSTNPAIVEGSDLIPPAALQNSSSESALYPRCCSDNFIARRPFNPGNIMLMRNNTAIVNLCRVWMRWKDFKSAWCDTSGRGMVAQLTG
jgi:hypothetical protein